MKDAIERAIEGGYTTWSINSREFPNGIGEVHTDFLSNLRITRLKKDGSPGRRVNVGSAYKFLLDPLFWQALGKELGWREDDERNQRLYQMSGGAGEMPLGMYRWHKVWHKFIDHLASNGNIDDFFNNLLK